MSQRDTIRVLVVDDHPVVAEGVAMLVDRDPSIEIVASASTLDEAVIAAGSQRPGVILLDLRLPGSTPPAALDALRQAAPGARIVIFTAYIDPATLRHVLQQSVDGCLFKDVGGNDLVSALHQVAAGEPTFDPRIHRDIPPSEQRRSAAAPLTRREFEVLRYSAMGKTNGEIGELLSLTRNTVKTYLQVVYQKLGAHNRVEAIARASELGLL